VHLKEIQITVSQLLMMKKALLAILCCLAFTSAATPEDSAPSSEGETQGIISFLNQTIVWYRGQLAMQQMSTEPTDVLYVNENRELANEVLRQSFDFARARAQILTDKPSDGQANADTKTPGARYHSVITMSADADRRLAQATAEVDDLRRRIQGSTGAARSHLEAALAEAQSEVALMQSRRNAIRDMVQFLSKTNADSLGSGTLGSQIDELAKTVPAEALASSDTSPSRTRTEPAQAAVAQNTRRTEPSGILALISDLMTLQRKKETIETNVDATDSLAQASRGIREPLVAELRTLMTRGDQLANAPTINDPAALAQRKKDIDALTSQFKQYSAAVLPLGKQSVLLDVYKRTLGNWQSSVVAQHRSELKNLILRMVILGILIGLIAAGSEVWRKATFRYVHDSRRRYQFLLMRRIVVWIVIALVVAFSFAAELGTLATFAGLLTAGIAVALQNVILSIAGYFFLIGRYGVRVGDRVQIASVTGDVIDIGLVRIHIMEAISGGSDVRPTGRVVVFSNAVVFQPNAGLFKQIPGTNFVWHEITLTLAPDSNYHRVEERLMDGVRKVYAKYKAEMEGQRQRMEQSLTGVVIRPLGPESRLRLAQSGLEVMIRYPVVLTNAAAVDDEMTRALLNAIEREPRLKLVGTGTPNIQAVTEKAS
jgi:small-conductance mechanosensitive channel